jgi:hypothetical protein
MSRFIQGLIATIFTVSVGCSNRQAAIVPDADALMHIEAVVASLPQDSSLRRTLEAGHYGDGRREAWMDGMRAFGIKQAMFEVHGVWHGKYGFNPQSIGRAIYRKQYDDRDSQIINASELGSFRQKGLENTLREAAFRRSKTATWFGIDSSPAEAEKCFVDVYLFDDQWLRDDWLLSANPTISRYNPFEFPLHEAAAVADLASTQQLLAKPHFSQSDLDTALFSAVKYPSDNAAVISLLLQAGANVNAERPDRTTPLMDAVWTLNLSNMKLLVIAGADVLQQNSLGWTPSLLAEQKSKQIKESKGRLPEYMPEVISLLKPTRGQLAFLP